MSKHITLDAKESTIHSLDCGSVFAEMAGMFHRAEFTISHEVKNGMIYTPQSLLRGRHHSAYYREILSNAR